MSALTLDLVRNVFSHGDDPGFVPFDALQGSFQFLGVAELRLDLVKDARFRNGLVHIVPSRAIVLVHRAGDTHAGKVVQELRPVLRRAVAERFGLHGRKVHRVVAVHLHLVRKPATVDGCLLDAVVGPVGRKDVAPLGLVDPEVFAMAHGDVRLVHRDGQLQVDVVDVIKPGRHELVGDLDDRTHPDVLRGEGEPAGVVGVLLVELIFLGHLGLDHLPILPVVGLHLHPGILLLDVRRVEVQKTEISIFLSFLLEHLDPFMDRNLLDDGDIAVEDKIEVVRAIQHQRNRRCIRLIHSHIDLRVRHRPELGVDRNPLRPSAQTDQKEEYTRDKSFHIVNSN